MLKDKELHSCQSYGCCFRSFFMSEDVEKAVLKFQNEINKCSEKRDDIITIGRGEVVRLIDEIFGEFKK